MTTQRVFRLPQRTSIQDLQVSEEDVPSPSAQEVLIRIKNVALNFRDFAVSTGKYPFPVKDNVVPCSDLSGEVVRVGSHVEDFAEGDKVIASFDLKTLYGAMPDWHHSLGTTAWNALYGNVPLKPGQTVLFLGTGGVSITGLILARAAGAVTIITSSSDDKLAHVQKTYGADYTVNYKSTPAWSQEVLKITNGHGADFILENGGAGTIGQSIDAVAYGGNIAVIGFLASCPQEKMPDVAALALSKGAIVRGIMVGSKQQLEDVTRFVSSKNLNVPVEKVFGFGRDEVVSAFEYLVSGQHIGKVCIAVN
ncbi:hypothetical protein J4E83_010633 [Alternaria metachromatica]|uniref:uncharacterized protein n=1 Tax=Alternaria metachromatica TaxID=283354 RepID=UPI0020C2BC10|nr:uncharacterized protein J4E83_010633 [Alternaria metachromatica]KAI4605435.1 hypothetical protein J4E83_010633 [Alternaria metachromatica]